MKTHLHPSDLRGAAALAVQGVTGVADLVEAMHHAVLRPPGMADPRGRTRGITGLVYRMVRAVARRVGGTADAALAPLVSLLGAPGTSSAGREAVRAALNGVLGDHLAASGNPLAIPMSLRSGGRALELTRGGLATAFPEASGRVLVLAHGLCMNDLQWSRRGHDHGAALAREGGFTPVYLHYNTGLHTSVNARAFARLLETLLEAWPVPVAEVAVVAHSMGGLVTRGAFHHGRAAGHRWPGRVRRVVFLGTPHHGAPLERGGNWVDVVLGGAPYAAPLARLGKIRSAGITDLRHGNVVDEDWAGRDRFVRGADSRLPLPLPEGVECFAAAATMAPGPGRLRGRLLGDGLVPVQSALGMHADAGRTLAFPEERRWTGYGMNHMDLLSRPEVYAQLRRWLAP